MKWLYKGEVFHKRMIPKKNEFSYEIYFLRFPLAQIKKLNNFLFSVDSFNWLSIKTKEYGHKNGGNLYDYVREKLSSMAIKIDGLKIYLQTFPGVLGHSFNPVSFWICQNDSRETIAVIAQVNNTFGGSHDYVIHNHGLPINSREKYQATKVLHVSPFNEVEGYYDFVFEINSGEIEKIIINYYVNNQLVLNTYVAGRPVDYNTINLLKYFISIPLLSFKIIYLIHYQAFKLLLKKIPFVGARSKISGSHL